MLSLLVIAVSLLSIAVGSPRVAVAHDATPVTLPVTPDPAECTIEPRLLGLFERFVGTPTSSQATPELEASTPMAAFQVAAGQTADADTVASVLDPLRWLGDSLLAGAVLRHCGLFTDDYFLREFDRIRPLPEEDLAFATPPEPVPVTDRAALCAGVDVRVLGDGRVAGQFDVYAPFAKAPGRLASTGCSWKRTTGT